MSTTFTRPAQRTPGSPDSIPPDEASAPLALPLSLPIGPHPGRIPKFHATWYRFCSSREVGRLPLSRMLLGRKLVAYRGDSGRVVVLDGRCVHQGADLSAGTIVGDSLRCPFHGWCFGADGVCNHIPATQEVPAFARIRSYPTEERHGDIYFFNSHAALFPLPFFRDADPRRFAAARVFTIEYDGPWYMIVANAFDMQHFRVVHDRKLIGEPMIDHPTPFARRIRYEVSVDGDILADRFLRRFVGDRVRVDQTVYGGNVLTTHARFEKGDSYVFFVASSTPDGRTRMDLRHAPRK